MAAAAIEAIGVISGALGIIQFGLDNFGGSDGTHAALKVAVGLDGTQGLSNSGGDLPDVRTFNENGEFLGITADPGGVTDGTVGDVSVSQNGQQATYTLFSANDDAICVAWTTITWPDNNKYAVVGDWGKACGGSWFYSGMYIDGTDYKPSCFWVDKNGDAPKTGFQVHWPDLITETGSVPSGTSIDGICGSPSFNLKTDHDPSGISYYIPGKRSEQESVLEARRASAERRAAAEKQHKRLNMAERLVIDDYAPNSVEELCNSDTSVGPDYLNISLDQFCDMTTKTIYPVCDAANTDECFDKDALTLISGGKAKRSDYARVTDWTKQ